MFADMELIGVPHRLVVSEKGLGAGTVEYKGRRDDKPSLLPQGEAVASIRNRLAPV